MLEKLWIKELVGTSSSIYLIHCPKTIRTYTMKIRNVKDDISAAITLNPEKQPTKGKEMETLEGSNTQFVMSKFII